MLALYYIHQINRVNIRSDCRDDSRASVNGRTPENLAKTPKIIWPENKMAGVHVRPEPVERPPYPWSGGTYTQGPHVTYGKIFLGACRCMTVVVQEGDD